MKTEPTANILIVDDDPRTLLAMEALLSGPGRHTITAASGQEALRRLLRQDFSVILMDVRMVPGIILWLLGVPLSVLVLLWLFGVLS